jgi:hypothetical protein
VLPTRFILPAFAVVLTVSAADGNVAIVGGIADNMVIGAAWVHSRRGRSLGPNCCPSTWILS